jgi:hypothetical protein
LGNIIIFVALSSSVVSLPYEHDELIPSMNYQYPYQDNISNWKENSFNNFEGYLTQNVDARNILAILEFSNKILRDSQDIDIEFVEIVNQNFWELI